MVEGDIEFTDGFEEIPPDSTGIFPYAGSVDLGFQVGAEVMLEFTREIGEEVEEWEQRFFITSDWSDTGKVSIDTSGAEPGEEGSVRIKLKATNALGFFQHLGTAEVAFDVVDDAAKGGEGDPKEPVDPESIWEQFEAWLMKLGFLLSAGVAAAIAYMATGRVEAALIALVVGGGLGCLVPWFADQGWDQLALAWLILSVGAGAVVGVYFRELAHGAKNLALGAKDMAETGISAAAETKGLIL